MKRFFYILVGFVGFLAMATPSTVRALSMDYPTIVCEAPSRNGRSFSARDWGDPCQAGDRWAVTAPVNGDFAVEGFALRATVYGQNGNELAWTNKLPSSYVINPSRPRSVTFRVGPVSPQGSDYEWQSAIIIIEALSGRLGNDPEPVIAYVTVQVPRASILLVERSSAYSSPYTVYAGDQSAMVGSFNLSANDVRDVTVYGMYFTVVGPCDGITNVDLVYGNEIFSSSVVDAYCGLNFNFDVNQVITAGNAVTWTLRANLSPDIPRWRQFNFTNTWTSSSAQVNGGPSGQTIVVDYDCFHTGICVGGGSGGGGGPILTQ